MRLKLRCFLICTFLCVPFLSSAGRGHDSLLTTAESLMAQGEYARAAIAFEYAMYKAEDATEEAKACMGKARAYKRMEDFEGALKSLQRVQLRPLGDTLHYEVRSEMAYLMFVTRRFGEADQQFKQMDFFLPKLELRQRSYFLRILTLNELRRWDEASTAAKEWVASLDAAQPVRDSLNTLVEQWYSKVPKLKKQKRAEVLSVIPGMGHWYSGYFGEGVVSMIVSLAALSYATFNVFAGNYLTALTLGTALLQQFLFGGARRARFLVKQKNYERTREFNNPIKQGLVDWQRKWGMQ